MRPQFTLQVTRNDQPLNVHFCAAPDLVAVPAGADPIVVVPNGDSAEGAQKRRNLNVEDVGQVALKLSPHQEYLTE